MRKSEAKLKNRTIVALRELGHILDNEAEYLRRFKHPVVKQDDTRKNVVRLSFES